MTFNEWWKSNEAEISGEFYKELKWTDIHRLLQKTYEAGKKSLGVRGKYYEKYQAGRFLKEISTRKEATQE